MPIDTGFETGVDGARLSTCGRRPAPAPSRTPTTTTATSGRPRWARSTATSGARPLDRILRHHGRLARSPPTTPRSRSGTTSTRIENYRYMLGSFWSGATIGTYWLRMDSAGNIARLTSKTGVTGYTTGAYVPIGTMPTGWTQVKMTLNFTSDTYTFSTRPNTASAWTPMKAAGAPDLRHPDARRGQPGLADHAHVPRGRRDRLQRRVRPRRRQLRHPDALGCRRHLRGRHRRRRAVHLLGPCGHRLPERRVRRHRHLRAPSRARSTATSRARPPRRRPPPTS